MVNKEECIKFIYDLANGIDPKTGELISDESILNRADVIRTLFAIKEYLESESKPETKSPKVPFKLTNTNVITEGDINISSFVNKINEMNCFGNMKKAGYKVIVEWLLQENYLFINDDNRKEPTQKGLENGISYKLKFNSSGRPYYVIEYNANAQRIILTNIIEEKINFEKNKEE